jgi:unsaturated chondroitin disaccharide hydrolase
MTDFHAAKYNAALDFAERQVAATIERTPDYFPIYTVGGRWKHDGQLWTDWTGGFLAGQMWQFVKRGKDFEWRPRAVHYGRLLEHRQYDQNVHDLGFIFLNTYRPWYEVTGDPGLRAVLIQAGRTLSLRFQERGQYLASFIGPQSLFIDIMMNVPLIFYAASEAHDEPLGRLAAAHCRTTRDTLVRPDGSTAHEGIFDASTGALLRQSTHQGLGAESAWARGLAWSLYGYSQVYALTGDAQWLAVAERNADFWLTHLPRDHVPLWDFAADESLPPPWGRQKDASAAVDRAVAYRQTALAMLDALVEPHYLAIDTPGWEGILKHGVYHTSKNLGVDESVMWGDFFFVEALLKVIVPHTS